MSDHAELKTIFFNEIEEIQIKVNHLKKEIVSFIKNLEIRKSPQTKITHLIALTEKLTFLQNSIQVQEEFFPLNDKRGELLHQISSDITLFKSKIYTHNNLINAIEFAQKSKKVSDELKSIMTYYINPNEKSTAKKMGTIVNAIDGLAKTYVKNMEKLGTSLEHSLYIEKNKVKTLKGLSTNYIQDAKDKALKYNRDGALFLYNEDVLYNIMFCVKNREVRQKAYILLLSANSHVNQKFDNDKVLAEILAQRQQMAQLHYHEDYAELTMSTYLLSTSQEVLKYLNQASEQLSPAYNIYLNEIKKLARKDGISDIQAWDIFYYNGILSENTGDSVYTDFNEYFEIEPFFKSFFKLMEKQFNLTFNEVVAEEFLEGQLYKKLKGEVFAYEVIDNITGHTGYLLLDKFSSSRKKETRFICYNVNSCYYMDSQNTLSKPVGYVSLALEKNTTHLGFYEMKTIMHEFGHFLHFNFKSPNDKNLGWDLIEVPSQYIEQWMYNYETTKMFSNLGGKKLPKRLFKKMMEKEMYLNVASNYGCIEKYMKKIQLHKNVKQNIGKNPSEVYQLEHHLEGNITRDLYMLADDYRGDYAATEYIYLYSEAISYQLFKKWKNEGAHQNNHHARFLFTKVFNHPIHKQTKNVFSRVVNLKENNILELITKGLDLKLVGLN